MGAWWTNIGKPVVNGITASLDIISEAANAQDVPAVGSSCQQLHDLVSTAQTYPPVPVADFEASWSRALNNFANAAGDCVSAATESDTSLYQKAASELQGAHSAMTVFYSQITSEIAS